MFRGDSGGLPEPSDDMNVEERGKLLLQYVAARRPVHGLNFSAASLLGADLAGAALQGVILTGANLSGADLSEADLSGAELSRSNLQRARLVQCRLQDTILSSARLESAVLVAADLTGAQLSHARLQYSNLQRADLSHASLHQANLQRTQLRRAQLRSADLRGADLRWADLLMAELQGACADQQTIRASAWSVGALADLQRRGLTISARPPPPPPTGLSLPLAIPADPIERAALSLLLAAWSALPGHQAHLAPGEELRIVTEQPAPLWALLRRRRWADAGALTALASEELLDLLDGLLDRVRWG